MSHQNPPTGHGQYPPKQTGYQLNTDSRQLYGQTTHPGPRASSPFGSGPVSSPYGTSSHPQSPRRRRRLGFGVVGIVPFLAVPAIIFFAAQGDSSDYDVETMPGIGFATTQDQTLVLVPYHAHGGAGLFDSAFNVRLTAVDIDTGDKAWDVQLRDDLIWDAGVLASGANYSYLATTDGLVIVSIADGTVVARDGGIDGLGTAYVASYNAYGFDAERGVIVALDVNGSIHSIPLDSLTATAADAATAADWSARLANGPFAPDPGPETGDEAHLTGTDTVSVVPTAPNSMGSTLVKKDAQGAKTPIGATVFYNAGIVLDMAVPSGAAEDILAGLEGLEDLEGILNGTDEADIDELEQMAEDMRRAADRSGQLGAAGPDFAAGAAGGFVVVHHSDPNVSSKTSDMLSVVSLTTGEVISDTAIGSDFERAATASTGEIVIAAADRGKYTIRNLVVISPDGAISHIEIGTRNFFGFA